MLIQPGQPLRLSDKDQRIRPKTKTRLNFFHWLSQNMAYVMFLVTKQTWALAGFFEHMARLQNHAHHAFRRVPAGYRRPEAPSS